jgi:hypothetical protein
MADAFTLTAGAIVTLAVQKAIESGAGELAKKFTESAIAKMDDLRKAIWNKLRGKSQKLDEALVKAEQGDRAAIDTVAKYLDVAMEDYPDFATQVQAIAQEIHAGKLVDNSSMTQNNYDNARGWQTKVEGGTAYIGEIHQYGHDRPANP